MTKTKDFVSAIPGVTYKKPSHKNGIDTAGTQEDSNEARIMEEGDSDDSTNDNSTYSKLEVQPDAGQFINLQTSFNSQKMILPITKVSQVNTSPPTNHVVLSGGAILTNLVLQPPRPVVPNLVTLSGPVNTTQTVILNQPNFNRTNVFENNGTITITNANGFQSRITIPDRTDIFKVPTVSDETKSVSINPDPADRLHKCILSEVKRADSKILKISSSQPTNPAQKESFINNSVSIIKVCQNMDDSQKSKGPFGLSESASTSKPLMENGSSSTPPKFTLKIGEDMKQNVSPASQPQKIFILRAPLILSNGSNRFQFKLFELAKYFQFSSGIYCT